MAKQKLEWDLVTRLREGRRNGSHHRHIVGELDQEAANAIERLRFALRVIAALPLIEQDNMLSANMRKIAQEALDF